MNNIEKYKEDYKKLCRGGNALLLGFLYEHKNYPDFKKLYSDLDDEKKELASKHAFSEHYNAWYNESIRLIKQLMPERLDDFVGFYAPEKKRKTIDLSTYTISDSLLGYEISRNGLHLVGSEAGLRLFQQQLRIVASLSGCFESSLYNIKELLQADVFNSELDGAKELNKNGFYRAAGALCGVILEKHFAGVCESHSIKIKKGAPGISDYNEKFKEEGVIDNKTYLLIQRLGTIRNLCDHNKKQEPTKEDIDDLINGTDKVLHEVL